MPPSSIAKRKPVVFKFGGAALADAAAIRRVCAIVRASRDDSVPTVVVVSACLGVTDALLDIARRSARGEGRAAIAAIASLAARHRALARALTRGSARRLLEQVIREAFDECRALSRDLSELRELTPRVSDFIVARGERLSARIVAAALGTDARFVDAAEMIRTDGRYGEAFPDLPATDRSARRTLTPLLRRGLVPVVPGFIGAGPTGETVTLGRGGTDLSAALLGRAIGAAEISLWKDVPGLLTADPQVVPEARVLPQLHLREAAELAYYGAKVLHPRALIPLAGRRIRVRVRPVSDPGAEGTVVSAARVAGRPAVTALAANRAQAILTVQGNSMLGVPGIAARTFAALHEVHIPVSFISQASSEHSICFTVPARQATEARAHLLSAFRGELVRHEIDGVSVRRGVATLAVVGLGMAGTKGVAARVFDALRDARINVLAIALGSSGLNISVVMLDACIGDAQRAVHRAFQLDRVGGGGVGDRTRTDLVLLGYGQIGQRVAALAAATRLPRITLRVVGVIDSSGMLFDAKGLSARRLAALSREKRLGRPLARADGARPLHDLDAVAFAASRALHHPILVDVTAAETTPSILAALNGRMDVVLGNKRPLTGRRAHVDVLLHTARASGRHLLAEVTVGAGLPVLDTLSKLRESGDRVRRIEACLSGTLTFLFDEMGRGRVFSEALRDAMKHGYTEPDPRDDLSGLDVGRKALTLGRLIGYRGELGELRIESLVPKRVRGLPLAGFLASLATLDAEWELRMSAARSKGRVLRYLATATPRAVRVGLVEVDHTSPFAALSGTDNQVAFVTDRYADRPLVVTGPGAGPAVTAAGVMNDILSLARRAR